MRHLGVVEFVSLDGVMQAPGAADEDPEDGFRHGGWNQRFHDDEVLAMATEGLAATDAYLFGRRTYQKMAAYWPTAPADIPFTTHLNQSRKYVASTTLSRLDWQNSTLLTGDVAEAVAKLKAEPGKGITVLGSGGLVQTLLANDLIDTLLLVVRPLLLGGGKRLFRAADGHLRNLQLVNATTTSSGSVMLTYRPAR